VLVTPFAQLLNSLRNIRSNVMALANIAPARYVPCFHDLSLPRDAKLARYFRPSVCPSQAGIVSKRPVESSWGLAWWLSSAFTNFLGSRINNDYYATHTRLTALFPGPSGLAGTRKVKPIWILLKQETVSGSGISWAMSAPSSRQITTQHHTTQVFTGRMPFLPPNQQRQSTDGNTTLKAIDIIMTHGRP